MAFDEVRFPTDISYGAKGGPVYSTLVVETASGSEQRISYWSRGRLRWDVTHGVKSRASVASLIDFFRARKGRARGFRFRDPVDYRAENQPLAHITGNTWQLTKVYGDAENTEVRKITKPVDDITILRDGVPVTGWTLDSTTGIVSDLVAGGTLTWSGLFDVPCRFDTDEMTITKEDFDINNWDSITVVEIL